MFILQFNLIISFVANVVLVKNIMSKVIDLYEFLLEAELQQYYSELKNDLKVMTVPHVKFVTEDDLYQIGMTKPEIRRLKKYFQKYYPQNYFSKFKKLISSKDNKDHWSESSGSQDTLKPIYEKRPPARVPNKHIIPADSITINKELGVGEFGVVQQGVWTNEGDRIQVAIKCLSQERMQNNPVEFLKEAAIMHSIDNEHIVRLYGVVLDTVALMLVTELAPLRSLLECLKEPSLRASFPVMSLCDFAIQICNGMHYLETQRFIHRDLAARNILVFTKNKVKISDFGLSRALGVGKDYYQTNFNVNLKLPIAWCAPECISYLRFTSASDVWAYGVTLWEMFSYGFQPWAALTGQQILEAIDEPNFQRLEQPDCCPIEYFDVMTKCWQHDPSKRPRFADLVLMLLDCKPEQVLAVINVEEKKRDMLQYTIGDVITVLDKTPGIPTLWKGVLSNGKTGLFNPSNTVAYLGLNLPSNRNSEFSRNDSKYSSRRSRLRIDMISCPQGDVKHMGHVGLDGAYFGDIEFMSSNAPKYNHLPHQVVAPYKPHEDCASVSDSPTSIKACSDRAPLLNGDKSESKKNVDLTTWLDKSKLSKILNDHEYHEISDEDIVAESPRFEKTFDFGPSLVEEMETMFRTISTNGVSNYAVSPPRSPLDPLDTNHRNELREIAANIAAAAAVNSKTKKKQATVKPISASDEKSLDSAIAMANELANRSMGSDIEQPHHHQVPESPSSPNKRKFTFKFPPPIGSLSKAQKHDVKTFTDEAASIPDIQGSLTEEAKQAYNGLIEKPMTVVMDGGVTNSLRLMKKTTTPVSKPKFRLKKIDNGSVSGVGSGVSTEDGENDSSCNIIPLPPKDPRAVQQLTASKPRHQRKYPLVMSNAGGTSCQQVMTSVGDNEHQLFVDQIIDCCISDPEPKDNAKEKNNFQHTISNEVSFDERIALELDALDQLGAVESPIAEHQIITFQRPQPNVSEDGDEKNDEHQKLFEKNNEIRRVDNVLNQLEHHKDLDCDEVRIMIKVLGPKVSGEHCLEKLRVTGWDVHHAIKLAKLELALETEGYPNVEHNICLNALENTNWDIVKAASGIINNMMATINNKSILV
ncbi:activated Cdc42 kinase-like isoform X3 [Sipha flava]|uniref:non-specific protein-tyrosine kinase n=1 Tax=Sipha flava TaxID=143950 RepID=A0A8B8GKF4_9HEMI|nr:activated Cdc42 kinase-like isoform X3 [Sipha flava]